MEEGVIIHRVSVDKVYRDRCTKCDTAWSIIDKFIEAPFCVRCGYRAVALLGPVPEEPPAP